MDEERNGYYDIIREKITDPEIQKALDRFHAWGEDEQRLREEAAAPRAPETDEHGARPVPSAEDAPRPAAEPRRQEPPAEIRRPASPVAPGPHPASGEETFRGSPAPQRRVPASYRPYAQRSERQSVYSDSSTNDAYEAAYRDAMRKATGEKRSELRSRRAQFAVGVFVVIFAIFGFACAVVLGVRGVSAYQTKRNEERCAAYAARLIAVAAVDPEPFDDISAASMEDLIKVSVWSIVGAGVDPNRYTYANGELCVPQADVEAAYASYFGTQRPIVHGSAEGYGYTFQYSAEDAAYYIPMTTMEPLYTPRVTSVETKSGATVVTCGMISSGLWEQDAVTGDITAPDPDKFVRVTFRGAVGAEYINSMQSLGLPETAIPSVSNAAEPQPETDAPSAETTTEKQIVITWD
ncbi:MAG: hypothetical protein IJK89_06645 [Clostridia bacterium]|nr:hypothetical protein [Clostridia bacterium]